MNDYVEELIELQSQQWDDDVVLDRYKLLINRLRGHYVIFIYK